MAEKYFPFRSVSGDRKYSAEDWAAYFALFIGNGVFYSSADKLKVVASEGMTIKVNKGAAFVNGRGYILEENLNVTLDTADGVLNRIDRVVLRCDYINRLIEVVVKKGSYSQEPIAEELTRDADVYELALADVYVGKGVIEITTAVITDLRLNTALCGIVTGLVNQADTTEIFNQFKAYFKNWEEEQQQEFAEWFAGLKEILSEDVAGNLLKEIEELQADIAELQQRPIVETSNSNTVTEAGIALDARQANPEIEGTMAAKIVKIEEAINGVQIRIVNGELQYRYDKEIWG